LCCFYSGMCCHSGLLCGYVSTAALAVLILPQAHMRGLFPPLGPLVVCFVLVVAPCFSLPVMCCGIMPVWQLYPALSYVNKIYIRQRVARSWFIFSLAGSWLVLCLVGRRLVLCLLGRFDK
jgi:hypothetical protein